MKTSSRGPELVALALLALFGAAHCDLARLAARGCSSDTECGIDLYSKATKVCRKGECVCNPENSVLATVSAGDLKVHDGRSKFRGYRKSGISNVTLCAPAPGQPCANKGHCSPGSYCIYISRQSWSGTCTCVPYSRVSNVTGLCECLPGYKTQNDGTCGGSNINERCSDSEPCGLDHSNFQPLVCINGTCHCNPETSVYAVARTSKRGVYVDNPGFQGYYPLNKTKPLEHICAPKPERPCVGEGYCSPTSYCIYDGPYWSTGTCKCVPLSRLSNVTGLCECLPGYKTQRDGTCGANINERCSESEHCGLDLSIFQPLVCIKGTCHCNPEKSVYAVARTSNYAVNVGEPDFQGYFPLDKTKPLKHICAPKPEKPCVGYGYCSPNSYCVYDHNYLRTGTCKCNPNTVISTVTGFCECPSGNVDLEGNCVKSLPTSCTTDSECGLHPITQSKLVCSNRACICDPETSVPTFANSSLFIRAISSDSDEEIFPGFETMASEKVHICAMKVGQRCGKGQICAPGSSCQPTSDVHTDQNTCQCDETKVGNNATGMCECPSGQCKDNMGKSYGIGAQCVDSGDCVHDVNSGEPLECVHGRCICSPSHQSTTITYTVQNTVFGLNVITPNTSVTICRAKPGTKCTFGHCTDGLHCADENKKPVKGNGTCVCNEGTGMTSWGACQKLYQDPCDETRVCSAGLICVSNTCQCPRTSHWDEKKLICLSKPGAPCQGNVYCGEFGTCVDGKCVCKSGYKLRRTGHCSPPLTTRINRRRMPHYVLDFQTCEVLVLVDANL